MCFRSNAWRSSGRRSRGFAIAGQTALGVAEMEIRRATENLEDRLYATGSTSSPVSKRGRWPRRGPPWPTPAPSTRARASVASSKKWTSARPRSNVRHAEEKLATTKRWLRDLPTYLKEYEGPARGLGGFLETEVRQAGVLLDNKVAALLAYLSVAAPEKETP